MSAEPSGYRYHQGQFDSNTTDTTVANMMSTTDTTNTQSSNNSIGNNIGSNGDTTATSGG